MLNLRWLRLAVVGLLVVPYAAVMAQGLSTLDFVKGNYGKYATVLKLSELPDDYSAVRLAVSSSGTDPLGSLWPLMGLGGRGTPPDMTNRAKYAQAYWTNGDTVRAMNREFLITYKLDVDVIQVISQFSMDTGGEPKTKPTTPSLKINLVALDSIQSLVPCPELTKADLISTFGSSAPTAMSPASIGARQTSTLSNVKQIALGLIMYTNDYDDALPYTQSSNATWYVEYPYVKNYQIFKTLNPNGGMFRFNMGISGSLQSSIPAPAETVLVYESEPWPDGRRVVAFCDGHAKLVSADTWAEISKRLTPSGIKRVAKPLPVSYDKEFDKLKPPTTAPAEATKG